MADDKVLDHAEFERLLAQDRARTARTAPLPPTVAAYHVGYARDGGFIITVASSRGTHSIKRGYRGGSDSDFVNCGFAVAKCILKVCPAYPTALVPTPRSLPGPWDAPLEAHARRLFSPPKSPRNHARTASRVEAAANLARADPGHALRHRAASKDEGIHLNWVELPPTGTEHASTLFVATFPGEPLWLHQEAGPVTYEAVLKTAIKVLDVAASWGFKPRTLRLPAKCLTVDVTAVGEGFPHALIAGSRGASATDELAALQQRLTAMNCLLASGVHAGHRRLAMSLARVVATGAAPQTDTKLVRLLWKVGSHRRLVTYINELWPPTPAAANQDPQPADRRSTRTWWAVRTRRSTSLLPGKPSWEDKLYWKKRTLASGPLTKRQASAWKELQAHDHLRTSTGRLRPVVAVDAGMDPSSGTAAIGIVTPQQRAVAPVSVHTTTEAETAALLVGVLLAPQHAFIISDCEDVISAWYDGRGPAPHWNPVIHDLWQRARQRTDCSPVWLKRHFLASHEKAHRLCRSAIQQPEKAVELDELLRGMSTSTTTKPRPSSSLPEKVPHPHDRSAVAEPAH